MKATRFLLGNLCFNLGFVIVSFSGVWGNSFGTTFYDVYFTNPLFIGSALIIGTIGLLVSAATFSFIFPSGTKGAAYTLFTTFYWVMWGNTILIFSKFSMLVGDVGIKMIGMVGIIIIVLFIYGITQCELGGFKSHD